VSEQENNTEDNAGDTGVAADTAPAAPVAPAPRPPRRFSPVAWLALLLVLALAGALGAGAAWLWPRAQDVRAELQQRVDALESTAGSEEDTLAALQAQLSAAMQQDRAALESQLSGLTARLSEALVGMEAQLAEQRAELARFSANDRASWLLAEAEYLLRLANQRLVMAGDTAAARALLQSADGVLREIDDPGLHDARAAVAADLAAVRAVPTIDVQGIYLRLSALIEQADRLVIFAMPDVETPPRPEAAEDWQGRLRQGYEHALRKLSDYIVIRRRDVPMQALMDPQWEGLVRQNLRMLLEQAQVALLSGNGPLYRQSLERAQRWVEQFMESDPAAASAMAREIGQLGDIRVAVEMPDLARSLRALDEAVESRLQAGGGQ